MSGNDTTTAGTTLNKVAEPENGNFSGRWESAMLSNYSVPPILIDHGRGCEVFDAAGRRYLDFVGGIAVSSLGHAHPAIVNAVTDQIGKVAHTSNLYAHEVGLQLAERLQAFLPVDSRVFFCQDGATAMEAALKIVRRWAASHAEGDVAPTATRSRIIAADHSFHGRTFGALAVTGSAGKREPFAPFGHDVQFVPFGDAAALAEAVDDGVAAIVLEPIQGEAGVVVPPPEYLRHARDIADRAGCLLVVDEVQSGIGRTGAWLNSVQQHVIPDIVTLAKGLAGGLPMGAVIATGSAMTALVPGDHGSTFGGNPVSCAAALAVLDTIERENLLEHVRQWGSDFTAAITSLIGAHVAGVRGVGAWHAILLTSACARDVEAGLRARGVLVNAVQPDAVRVCPPLTVSHEHIAEFVDALSATLDSMEGRT